MIVNEAEAAKLAQFVFNSVRDRRWLYWPPGPMTGQVFDVNQCKKDLIRYLESQTYPLQEEYNAEKHTDRPGDGTGQ